MAIAVDLVRLASTRSYDAGILVSADTDLMPAIEMIIGLKLAHIEVATWAGANRLRFPNAQLPWCHYLSEADFRALDDPADYTRA